MGIIMVCVYIHTHTYTYHFHQKVCSVLRVLSYVTVMLKTFNLQRTFIILLHSNHVYQMSSPGSQAVAHCDQKNTLMTDFPVAFLSGCIRVYTTKDMCSDEFQTTSASGLSECVMNTSWSLVLYSVCSLQANEQVKIREQIKCFTLQPRPEVCFVQFARIQQHPKKYSQTDTDAWISAYQALLL